MGDARLQKFRGMMGTDEQWVAACGREGNQAGTEWVGDLRLL
jgi:hypothetical protein